MEGAGIGGCGHPREFESAMIMAADAMHQANPASLVAFASPYLAAPPNTSTMLDWGRLSHGL